MLYHRCNIKHSVRLNLQNFTNISCLSYKLNKIPKQSNATKTSLFSVLHSQLFLSRKTAQAVMLFWSCSVPISTKIPPTLSQASHDFPGTCLAHSEIPSYQASRFFHILSIFYSQNIARLNAASIQSDILTESLRDNTITVIVEEICYG
jgi:hypothetical protein